MRISIEIRDNIEPETALYMVRKVIEEGKVSTCKGVPCYCFLTRFFYNGIHIHVALNQYRKNTCFVVYQERKTK